MFRKNKIVLTGMSPETWNFTILESISKLTSEDLLIILVDHNPLLIQDFIKSVAVNAIVKSITHVSEGWQIEVRKGDEAKGTKLIADIVNNNWKTTELFEKYDLDYYFNGFRSLESLCDYHEVDYDSVKAELEQIKENNSYLNFNSWGLDYLVNYLIDLHNYLSEEILSSISRFNRKLVLSEGKKFPEVILIKQKADNLIEKSESYFSLKPPIYKLLHEASNLREKGEVFSETFLKKLDSTILEVKDLNRTIATDIKDFKKFCYRFVAPARSTSVLQKFCESFKILELELHKVFYLENNILFPKISDVEKRSSGETGIRDEYKSTYLSKTITQKIKLDTTFN